MAKIEPKVESSLSEELINPSESLLHLDAQPFLPSNLALKVDKTKYKTEMCKNWIEIGLCRYGTKCQFAHGEHELMGKAPPINNNKYKSKTCTTFNERLFCPYGQRCLFKHEDRCFDEVK